MLKARTDLFPKLLLPVSFLNRYTSTALLIFLLGLDLQLSICQSITCISYFPAAQRNPAVASAMWQRSRASRLWWTENWKPVDPDIRESLLKGFDDRYYLHILAIRAPPTPTSASNATTASNLPSTPAKSHHSLVPHWSYEKNSFAVAIVISVVTAIAFITLVILFVQKVRRSWRRHKREMKDYSGSRYRVYYMNDSELLLCQCFFILIKMK